MSKRDALRLPLTVSAIYVLAAAVIQLFPALAEVVFSRPITDPAIESLYGTCLLAIGGFAALIAADRNRSRNLVWMVIVTFLLVSINVAIYWAIGEYTAASVLAPIIINLVLAAWIFSAVRRPADAAGPAVTAP